MKILLLLLTLVITGCASTSTSEKGIYRPTGWTNNEAYLKEFPLNIVTEQEVFDHVGIPDKIVTSGDRKYLTIEIMNTPSQTMNYIYEIQKGVVTNVLYSNTGNLGDLRLSAKNLK